MQQERARENYRGIVRFLGGAIFLTFSALLWFVVRPFLTPLVWSIILTTTTWPVFQSLQRRLPSPGYLAPLLTTIGLGLLISLVIIPLPLQLATEIRDIVATFNRIDAQHLRASIESLPIVGPYLVGALTTLFIQPDEIASLIREHQSELLSLATKTVRGIVTTLSGTIASLVGCYILYRHGDSLRRQSLQILRRIGGESMSPLTETIQRTVRGAAYGILATALAQGALAGLGYYIAGAPTPIFLALTTTVFSLIPFGAPIVYLPVAGYLLFFTAAHWFYGVFLLAWGTLVVSTVDNLLRSLFISQSSKISAVLVFIGVIGGVASFGLLGVFVGPALMAVAQKFWLDFAQPQS